MLSNDRNPAKIPYKKFEKIILDFQMKSHEKFLSSFLQCFKQTDQDNNGIIDEVISSLTLSHFQRSNSENLWMWLTTITTWIMTDFYRLLIPITMS